MVQRTGNTPTGFFNAGQHSLPSSDLNLPHSSGMETFPDDDHMKHLSDSDDDAPKDGVFSINSFDDENTDNEEDGAPDYNNMDHTIDVSSTPTLRIHKNHPQSQIIGKSTAGVLTRRKLKESASVQHQALLSFMYKQNRTNYKDQQTCLFACFLSQEEPKKVSQALADESWVEAMQEELLQFKLQNFLGHVINDEGLHVDSSMIEAIKNWEAPRTPLEKYKEYVWGEEQERAFQTLKDKICNAHVLALLDRSKDFVG
ncbi:hypothetical protein Tco_0661019 [Tanacetum coccineum]